MEIIESLVKGKIDNDHCEDGLVITNDFVAVIDGSTSKTDSRLVEGMTNGRLAMLLIKEEINNLPTDTSLLTFSRRVTRKISTFCQKTAQNWQEMTRHPEKRLCASVIVYSRYRDEIWMIGDCQCLINGIYFDNPKPYEAQLAAKRAKILQAALLSGATVEGLMADDIGRKAILHQLVNVMKGENITYSVVDGFPIPMEHTKKISVHTLAPGHRKPIEVVMASDGYPFVRSTLSESEALLEKQLTEDPLFMKKFKATKGKRPGQVSFDDRAYVRFVTNS